MRGGQDNGHCSVVSQFHGARSRGARLTDFILMAGRKSGGGPWLQAAQVMQSKRGSC